MNNEKKSMKIKAVKGRAMLHWEGKHTIDQVGYYPPQLEEVCGVENPSEPTYENFESGPNLVFQGDNKEILSTLLVNGFREKIDLIYIDPPFASGADYIRKVALRGKKDKLKGEEQSVAEQIQYTDIWKNDTYLQFMYERLILMHQLLSDKGSIYLHCDRRMSHYLRCLLDEVFVPVNFVNEIIWCFTGPSKKNRFFPRKHQNIFFYGKDKGNIIFNTDEIKIPYKKQRTGTSKGSEFLQDDYEMDKDGKIPEDWWEMTPVGRKRKELESYPTQKPEALLERIIKTSSNKDSIVLDCFAGSGTTAVVAEKLGRRWITADMNKGAIQTTMKRIQKRIDNPRGIAHYRINNYDARTHLERRNIVIKKCGVQINKQDQFFDGTLDGTLVKIVDLTKPFTQLDLQLIKDELDIRPDDRNITVFCYGSESNLANEIDKWNSPPCVNNIIVREIGSEGIITFDPAQAEVNFERDEQSVTINIEDYISPTICDRLDIDNTLFDEHIEDFRAQIDCVLIDTDYNGEYFNQVQSDVPENKEDFVQAKYTLPIPRPDARVAVKIIDMLGEETIKIG